MQEHKSNEKNSTKGVSPILAAFSVLMICVFLAILFGMFTYFNVGGLGNDVIDFLRKNDVISREEQKVIEQEKKELNYLRGQLQDKENALKEDEDELQKDKESIKSKEVLLESEIKKYEQMRLSLTPEFENIQTIVELFSAMDAKVVADIFEKQDDMDLKVKIIKSMDISFASSVLSNMSSEKAAALLKKVADN